MARIIQFSDNKYYNLDEHMLYINGKPIDTGLNGIQLNILEYLAQNSPNFMSEGQIREHCWPKTKENSTGSLPQHISLLRNKIRDEKINSRTFIYIIQSDGKYKCSCPITYKDKQELTVDAETESKVDKTENNDTESATITTIVQFTKPDTLTQGRELSKAYFKQISDRGRFKSYINTDGERIVIKNRLKTSKHSNEYDLCELVFGTIDDNKTVNDRSISLHGIGGTGKTHQLLSLYDLVISEKEDGLGFDKLPKDLNFDSYVPFYLELNDVRTNLDNCILVELARRLSIDLDALINIFSEEGCNVILLLDGYNEVTNGELREEIAKRICDIRRDYKTKIVITSRLDHSDMFNRINRGESADFTQAEIQPLSAEQIDTYFKAIGLHNTYYKRLNKSVKRLVQTAQGLAMYGDLRKKKNRKRIENLGSLLREYVNDILLEDVEDNSFETYLEEIAYHMVLNGWFEIDPDDLKSLIDGKHGSNASESILNNSSIIKLFDKDSKGNYEFTHQNFRDMYCALFFNKLTNNLEKNIDYFTSNNVTTNDEILVLCGDLIKNDRAIQVSINKLKSKPKLDYSFVLSVLIRIFAFRNNNDIHTLNLSGLNLSKVSLSGYILYRKDYQICKDTGRTSAKTSHINIDGATLSEDTFETSGLKRGSSTICKYSKNGTEYIVAFCSDNLVIYNTKTTKWESIRYQFKDTKKKFGWINCACHVTDRQVIYLGTDNGYITFFSYSDEQPYINTDPAKFLKYDEKKCQQPDLKYGCSIQSILQVREPKSGKNIFIASNSAGAIFVLESDKNEVLVKSNKEQISEVRQKFIENYDEDNLSICRLTANSEYLFYLWDNKIYRHKLSNSSWDFEEWKSLDQECIFDICCTEEYLFVNTGKNILVFSSTNEDTNREILDSYTYSTTQGKETRQDRIKRFTKISRFENRSDKVLIGIAAEDQDRNTVPNYIMLTIAVGENEDGDEEFFIKPDSIFGIEQTMTTFTAASFNQDGHAFIATTSNDRSVQILSVDMEDFKAIRHSGTYDGIHHIENISSNELLLAQYDGSVSHWKYNDKHKEWRCMDVYPIHHDWVWKTRYYVDDDGNAFFFSCSYDGTVKRTNMKTYETSTLIEDDDKIIDLALIKDHGILTNICAVTTQKIISYDINDSIPNDTSFYDTDNLYKSYPSYAIRSVTPGVGEYADTVLIAVNFYENNTSKLAKIYSFSSNNIILANGLGQVDFDNYMKIDELTTKNDNLMVIGNIANDVSSTEKVDVYTSTSIEQLDLSKLKSISELTERRIVCVSLHGEDIFIGCLDGSVFVLSRNDVLDDNRLCNLTPAFLTHANLISTFPVKMVGTHWENDCQKDSFKGYFQIK